MTAPITVSITAHQRALTAVLDDVAREHGDEELLSPWHDLAHLAGVL